MAGALTVVAAGFGQRRIEPRFTEPYLPHPDFSAKGIYTAPVFAVPQEAPAEAGAEPLYGNVIYSTLWSQSETRMGIYEFPTTGVPEALAPVVTGSFQFYGNGGSVYTGEEYYVVNYMFAEGSPLPIPVIYTYDTDTWQRTGETDADLSAISLCMTYDEMTEKIYGCFFNESGTGFNFASFDPSQGRSSKIRAIDKEWNACAASPAGVLYAIDLNGALYTVDKANGAQTYVGDTGLRPAQMSSAAFNPMTGVLYYVCCPSVGNSALYKIDPVSAEATLLYKLPGGEGVTGLFIRRPASSTEAPAAVGNLKAEFPEGSLSGTVSFDMPTSTYAGDPVSGMLGYKVTLNGTMIENDVAEAGSHVSVPVTVETPGNYRVEVEPTSDKGSGVKAVLSLFIGVDKPALVSDVRLTADGNDHYTVNWPAVIVGVNGGYIDAANVAYTVKRYSKSGVETVASGIRENTFAETYKLPAGAGSLSYGVSATVAGETTAETRSNVIVIGQVTPPYFESFGDSYQSQQGYDDYTVIDSNGDGKTWGAYNTKFFLNCWAAKYDSKNPKDDWLITPPMYLEGGKQYDFSFKACSYSDRYTEEFEVGFGTEPTAAGMATTIMPRQTLATPTGEPREFKASAMVPADGVYYFGIHAVSEADKFYIFVDDIAVSAPRSAAVPAAPSDFAVRRYTDGTTRAELSFTLPERNIDGTPIDAITSLEIRRDGLRLVTLTSDLVPGQAKTYTDDDRLLIRGKHVYTIAASNATGRGNEATAEAYVGIARAEPVPDVRAALTANEGEVAVTWGTPSLDVNGEAVNTDLMTYTVLSSDEFGNVIEVASGLKANEFIHQAVEEGVEQRFATYAVTAVIGDLMSSASVSNIVVPGAPYRMPYTESFPGHTASHIMGSDTDSEVGAQWGFYKDDTFEEISSQDGDDGFIGFQAKNVGAHSGLLSGKIRIEGENPTLSFYYVMMSQKDDNVYDVVVTCEGKSAIEASFTNKDSASPQYSWVRAEVPLGKYAGKDIQYAVWVTCNGVSRAMFDNFRINNQFDHNLAAVGFEGSAVFTADTDSRIVAAVENLGRNDAAGYSVELLVDGRSVAAAEGPALRPLEKGTVAFSHRFSIQSPENVRLSARINYTADQYAADDVSAETMASIIMPDFPAPADPTARFAEGNGVELCWTATPAQHIQPVAVSESFESYAPWAKTGIGEWLSIDRDGERRAQMEQIDFPVGSEPLAFFVLDRMQIDPMYRAGFAPRSGDKVMANLPINGSATNTVDDWLVSPQLLGKPQIVSFYARSYNSAYPETFEIWVSETDRAPESMKRVARYNNIADTWTRYEFDVDAEARYFAIRCVSNNMFLLLLDDFSFYAKNGSVNLATLRGYNVYRDGRLITPEPVSATTFHDPEGGSCWYTVTAVYDRGESRPSAAVNPDPAGIDTVEAPGAEIYVDGNDIVIGGASGRHISVYAADGSTVYTGQGAAATRVRVPSGVYIVSVGQTVTKVAVR